MSLVYIKRSFQGLSIAVETVRINEELMEIWPNDRDNKNKTLVKPEWLEVRRTETVEIMVKGVDLLEKVK